MQTGTVNLQTCAYTSINTKKNRTALNANRRSYKTSPANSPTMHSRLVHQDRTKTNEKHHKMATQEGFLSLAILAIHSLTRSLSRFRSKTEGTTHQQHIHGQHNL